MEESNRPILVTGGAGFIGGNFVLDLVGTHKVINLDALTYAGNLDTLAPVAGDPGHVFVRGSIGDRPLVEGLLAEHRPRAIVNFAAETHVDRSIDGPKAFVQTNVVETLELLEAALAYWQGLEGEERLGFRFVHVSTDEVYGTLGSEGFFTEETAYRPNSPYAASKAASDHLVRAFHHTYGLPTLTTNCSNNYGPYQFPEKLIPLMIYNALRGEPLPVYGDGRQVRDWLYVKDHCRAVVRVLEAGTVGEVYNVGGHNERTNLDVVQDYMWVVGRAGSGLPTRAARVINYLRRGPARPRPALRHRRGQDRTRARLDPGRDLRERYAEDRALVPEESGVVRGRALG